MLMVEDISEQNLKDVFEICSRAFKISPSDTFGNILYRKGLEVRKQWLLDRLAQQGHCVKIAYLDGKPVAQIQFCPEETIPYIRDPRKDVVDIMCTYNPIPEAQRKGVATALVKALTDECDSGLGCLGGRPCRFVATLPFPYEARPSLPRFYEKCGFKQGHKEMFLEIKGEYEAREIPEYRPLPRDLDRTIILYNPACVWGYFYAFRVQELVQGMDPDHPIEIYDIWENPEEYTRRNLQRVTAGRAIVKGQVLSGGIFWTDREAFLREMKEAMGQ